MPLHRSAEKRINRLLNTLVLITALTAAGTSEVFKTLKDTPVRIRELLTEPKDPARDPEMVKSLDRYNEEYIDKVQGILHAKGGTLDLQRFQTAEGMLKIVIVSPTTDTVSEIMKLGAHPSIHVTFEGLATGQSPQELSSVPEDAEDSADKEAADVVFHVSGPEELQALMTTLRGSHTMPPRPALTVHYSDPHGIRLTGEQLQELFTTFGNVDAERIVFSEVDANDYIPYPDLPLDSAALVRMMGPASTASTVTINSHQVRGSLSGDEATPGSNVVVQAP